MVIKKEIKDFKNISEYTYTVLKDNILTLHLEPGRKISETEISENLKISRTPVREAIIKLAQEGIIQVQAQRGSYVSKIDLSFVEEAHFVRRALEEKVISSVVSSFSQKDEASCRHILFLHKQIPENNYEEQFYYDELFHRAIYASAEKKRTWDMITNLSWDYRRIRYLTLVDLVKMNSIIQDHETILNAITNKNEAAALQATRKHLDNWLEEKISISTQHAEYFVHLSNT